MTSSTSSLRHGIPVGPSCVRLLLPLLHTGSFFLSFLAIIRPLQRRDAAKREPFGDSQRPFHLLQRRLGPHARP